MGEVYLTSKGKVVDALQRAKLPLDLPDVAEHTSVREREAGKIEYLADDICLAWLLEDRLFELAELPMRLTEHRVDAVATECSEDSRGKGRGERRVRSTPPRGLAVTASPIARESQQ